MFEQVKKARPRVLLLWQDGPREGREEDVKNILECRKIADEIDWECEVHKNYHEKNMGCDPSTHLSHKWAFSLVDKCIILEDDIVPSQSFFRFCKELLDKYEYDTRVDRICGQTLYGGIDVYKRQIISNTFVNGIREIRAFERNVQQYSDFFINNHAEMVADVKKIVSEII